MPMTTERLGQLREREKSLAAQIRQLRAACPGTDMGKASARRWAEQVDSLATLHKSVCWLIRGAALQLEVEDPPGVTTIARIRKGENVEFRVAVVQTSAGRRVHIRRWRAVDGSAEWAPTLRAIVLTLGELQVLTAGLMVAEAAVLKGN
jgi:hypothetical protein